VRGHCRGAPDSGGIPHAATEMELNSRGKANDK
jgi:hypothetical protein